jgi:hypothetical protein
MSAIRDKAIRLKIIGRQWVRKVVRSITHQGDKCWGLCVYGNRVIKIEQGQEPRREFETDAHELIHAIMPWLHEETVREAAEIMADYFYDKLNYRRIAE